MYKEFLTAKVTAKVTDESQVCSGQIGEIEDAVIYNGEDDVNEEIFQEKAYLACGNLENWAKKAKLHETFEFLGCIIERVY